VFETVLDAMRSGKLPSSQDTIDTLLQANDVLSDLIGMSRSGDVIPVDYGLECRALLERILQVNSRGDEWGDEGSAAVADFDGLDFVPVRSDQFDTVDEQPGEQQYRIVFRPKPDLLKKANEPLYILRELRRLGTLALSVETERLPLLMDLEPDRAYLGWTGTLQTSAPVAQIHEVFEFVFDDCELEIVAVQMAADASPSEAPADTSGMDIAARKAMLRCRSNRRWSRHRAARRWHPVCRSKPPKRKRRRARRQRRLWRPLRPPRGSSSKRLIVWLIWSANWSLRRPCLARWCIRCRRISAAGSCRSSKRWSIIPAS
jgi:chemotaxis protein histidine kinase CheA